MKNIDNVKLSFGKYKGITPNEIYLIDPKYIIFLYEKRKYENYKKFCSYKLYCECAKINLNKIGLEDMRFSE